MKYRVRERQAITEQQSIRLKSCLIESSIKVMNKSNDSLDHYQPADRKNRKDSWDMLAVHVSDIICMLYLITVFPIWLDEGGIDVARFGHGH